MRTIACYDRKVSIDLSILQSIAASSRRNIALSFRHTLYSLLLSFFGLANIQLGYNQKARYLQIRKNSHSINSATPVLYKNHKKW